MDQNESEIVKEVAPELVLANEVKILNKFIKRMTSMRYRFLYGIIEGFGGVIGATILVSIVVFILTKLEGIEFLRPIAESILNLAGK